MKYMIDFKKENYIYGDSESLSYGVHQILDFFDLIGKNILFLYKKSYNNNLRYFVNFNKIEFTDYDSFLNVLEDKGNLFRVNLVVLDIFNQINTFDVNNYIKILKENNIDFIVITKKEFPIFNNSNSSITKLRRSHLNQNEVVITNIKKDETYLLKDYKKSYIRNIKIEQLLNNNNNNK